WGDWLGTGIYRSFEEARAFARSLGLKSGVEWRAYAKSGQKPDDIPASPNKTYAEVGWASWGDWLGTGIYRSFEEGRAFARSLGLKSQTEWLAYAKSGQKPDDIPFKPDIRYADQGWTNWGDWLGTGTIWTALREYRSFEEARAFARSLGLKSSA